MAQRLLKLEATFRDEDSLTDWQQNGCPFVVTKRKTRTEIIFDSFGTLDNSLFSVEERTRLFSDWKNLSWETASTPTSPVVVRITSLLFLAKV